MELESLDRRIAELEGRNLEDPGKCTNIISVAGIGKEKMAAFSMISTNNCQLEGSLKENI